MKLVSPYKSNWTEMVFLLLALVTLTLIPVSLYIIPKFVSMQTTYILSFVEIGQSLFNYWAETILRCLVIVTLTLILVTSWGIPNSICMQATYIQGFIDNGLTLLILLSGNGFNTFSTGDLDLDPSNPIYNPKIFHWSYWV